MLLNLSEILMNRIFALPAVERVGLPASTAMLDAVHVQYMDSHHYGLKAVDAHSSWFYYEAFPS
jgi:hypothetical protein